MHVYIHKKKLCFHQTSILIYSICLINIHFDSPYAALCQQRARQVRTLVLSLAAVQNVRVTRGLDTPTPRVYPRET